MEFRTLHLNSKPSPNGEGSIWNYVSTPTTLLPGENLPCEDVPTFSNAEKALWMEAKRVCEIDPAFQGWNPRYILSAQVKNEPGGNWYRARIALVQGDGGKGRKRSGKVAWTRPDGWVFHRFESDHPKGPDEGNKQTETLSWV